MRLQLQLTAQLPDLGPQRFNFVEELEQTLRAEQPLDSLQPLVEVTCIEDRRLCKYAGGMYETRRKREKRRGPPRIHSRTR